MKKTKKLIAAMLVAMLLVSVFACNAFAAKTPSVAELQKSVVLIQSEFRYTARYLPEYSFSMIGQGTGFAIGDPDEPVQYIATCNHCIYEPSGVYLLVLDSKGNRVKFEKMEEGTVYPQAEEENGYLYCIDYFKVELVEALVIYSAASGDYTSISVINSDESSDVAICKLASDPTDKIQARPFQIHENVEVGTNVYAIGYPFTSDYVNDECKYDYKDSTVTKGIISKSQLTYGHVTKERQFFTYLIDADITNGNSGGPLITENGSIIGLNSFGVSNSEKVANANYAIAIDELITLMDQSKIKYVIEPVTNTGLIIGIVAAVVAVAAIAAVVIVLLMMKKKKVALKPAAAPAFPAGMPSVAPSQPSAPIQNPAPAQPSAPAQPPVNNGMPFNYAAQNNNKPNNTTPINNPDPEKTIPVRRAFLVGVSGLYNGDTRRIESRIVIGRNASKCTLAFPENSTDISNVHCEIYKDGDKVVLTDLGSTNGTFLANGTRLNPNESVVLNNGDKFWIASQQNTFEIRC